MSFATPPSSRSIRVTRIIPRSGNFNLYSWFFMRVSGVFLLFLVFGHVIIMHLLNDIRNVNYTFVATRWETPFWRTYDWLMLVLALAHGAIGLKTLIDDYVHAPGWRIFALAALVSFAILFIFIGSLVVLTFRPV